MKFFDLVQICISTQQLPVIDKAVEEIRELEIIDSNLNIQAMKKQCKAMVTGHKT